MVAEQKPQMKTSRTLRKSRRHLFRHRSDDEKQSKVQEGKEKTESHNYSKEKRRPNQWSDDEKALQKEAAKLKSEWLKNHSNAQELLKQIRNNAKYHRLNNEQNGGQLGKAVEHVKKNLSQWQSEFLVHNPKTMKARAPDLWISNLEEFLKLKRRIQKVGKQHQCCMKIKASTTSEDDDDEKPSQ